MRSQVKQVVQRRKTVLMQEAALVAAPVTVQEQLKPKREAMAESRKSRKTLLLSANVDMETLAAEEEEFARMERELQEEEERLLHEEEERVKAEFASLQRMGTPLMGSQPARLPSGVQRASWPSRRAPRRRRSSGERQELLRCSSPSASTCPRTRMAAGGQ